MAERTLARLRLDGRNVAEYVDGSGLEPVLAPRPHLHPVRTLGGRPVTDAGPADHRWHLGLSVALQDVDGCNFWGGPTYLRGRGYTWREDHGWIEHAGFAELGANGFGERLRWLGPGGRPLLTERRRVRARLVEPGWELEISTALTNAAGRALVLGAPGDIEQSVADHAGQHTAHQGAGVAGRMDVAVVEHGVPTAANFARGRRLGLG